MPRPFLIRSDIRIAGVIVLLALIVAVDAISSDLVLQPFTVVPVLVASTFATARLTAFVALLATGAAIGLGIPDDEFGTADHVVRTLAVVAVALFAIYIARARQSREEGLQHVALHDPLTGLPNRMLLADRLHQLSLRRDAPGVLAVFFVDLDGFKAINDNYGHAAGDTVLRHAARCLQGVKRAGDTLARYGGDEFVLLCPDLPGPAAAAEMAERIRVALAQRVTVGTLALRVSASIGIAIEQGALADDVTLLNLADEAMYSAKRRGDHGYVMTIPEPRAVTPAFEG
jgi:diguanylate cyclase (GGDEF)-like protein